MNIGARIRLLHDKAHPSFFRSELYRCKELSDGAEIASQKTKKRVAGQGKLAGCKNGTKWNYFKQDKKKVPKNQRFSELSCNIETG